MPFLNLESSMKQTNDAGPRLSRLHRFISRLRIDQFLSCNSKPACKNSLWMRLQSFSGWIEHLYSFIPSDAPHGLFFLPTHDLSGSDQVDEGLEMIVPDIFFAFPIQHSKPQLSHRNNQPQVKQYHYRRFSYNGGTTGYMMMGQWPWGRSTSVITLKLEALAFSIFLLQSTSVAIQRGNTVAAVVLSVRQFFHTLLSFLFVFRLLAIVF